MSVYNAGIRSSTTGVGEGEGVCSSSSKSNEFMLYDVRYALACRDATNQALSLEELLICGLGFLRHDKLKHIGHYSVLRKRTSTSPKPTTSPSSINLDSPYAIRRPLI